MSLATVMNAAMATGGTHREEGESGSRLEEEDFKELTRESAWLECWKIRLTCWDAPHKNRLFCILL